MILRWLAVLFVCVVRSYTAETPSDVTIEACGLRVIAPLPVAEDKLRAFNWSPGTTVALLIRAPGGGLVQFDHKNSALTKFIDGKGNDLLPGPNKEAKTFGTPGFSLFPNISPDGKACSIEVTAHSIPAKDSGAIKLEGTLTLLIAKEKKEFALKDVPLKKGSKITAEKTELVIEKAGKPEWGNEPLAITLRSHNTELDEVAEIKFFKDDGTEIKARRTGSSKMGILGAMTVDWDYVLADKVDALTVKVYLWADLQKKKVPFSLSVDVGL
jgi:hypothetical protein